MNQYLLNANSCTYPCGACSVGELKNRAIALALERKTLVSYYAVVGKVAVRLGTVNSEGVVFPVKGAAEKLASQGTGTENPADSTVPVQDQGDASGTPEE